MIVAETKRLKIFKFSITDAPFFLELVNSPNWIKYIGDRNTKTIKDAEERITKGHLKNYKEFGFGFYKLLLKEENNKSIGTCGLIKREELDDVDIGFAFLPEYEGKGYGFEASVEIMKLAKNQFNLKRLAAITTPENKNSIKLLEKLGFNFEKRIKPFEDGEELLLFAKNL
ncbi:GNAT family N-acetyltransferase [Flaviramulus sp. BrNp1-15]|uniref:GNAT family N-acetyltransferase n=1 Tax=Flaviramulus sp. BrNp1-15 TaxID=2916754 RepID=UPI001EE8F027|nr:GNAT family N-acetyltransferase [Flaviramulus sp. BrNp1-15]ULC59555.1 GNAT family N-acetyltransferase [Flaviramulus sp. BrNp1-15]